MTSMLDEAEALEQAAAASRVAYYRRLAPAQTTRKVLDLGCGNGYSVMEWRAGGAAAFGVDASFSRAARWLAGGRRGLFVVGDAQRLPFRRGAFDLVVSSGMIEHVGVTESSSPYGVVPLDQRDEMRQGVVFEAVRLLRPEGRAYFDFPNGRFPVDFWHGDSVGSFRVHGPSDALLPTGAIFRRWARRAGSGVKSCPLGGRLMMRQVSRRWWGRALRFPMTVYIGVLDLVLAWGFEGASRLCSPYLVFEVSPGASTEARGSVRGGGE